jgi:hypothetical protein
MRPAKLINLALGGAAFALLIGVGFFFAPFGANQSLANRGTAAAALVSGFAVVLTALTLITTVRVEGSDFRAEERVKEDVTRLLATFRSIYLKAAWLSQQENPQDDCHASLFDNERQVVQDFLNSTTAPAFYALEGRLSAAAGSGKEEWRSFSLHMINILRAVMPADYRVVANSATRAERLITLLPPEDITALSKSVASLPRAIEEFATHRSETVLGAIAFRAFGGEEEELILKAGIDMLTDLKRQGVQDPDIDFFLGLYANDTDRVRDALAAGAHPSTTINKVLSRHAANLAEVPRSDQDQRNSSGEEGQRAPDASAPADEAE